MRWQLLAASWPVATSLELQCNAGSCDAACPSIHNGEAWLLALVWGGAWGGAIACGGRPPLGQVAALAINARPLLEQVSPRRRGLLRRATVAAGCGGGGLSAVPAAAATSQLG